MSSKLFSSFKFRNFQLANRVVMSPMTRSRAIDNIPNDLMATYYAQRAGAGLIITEGTAPCLNGLGYARIPGLYTDAQVEGWRKVTDAVHQKGSKIFVQLMHTGRICHPLNFGSPHARVLAPSPIAAAGNMYTDASGMLPHPVPTEMSLQDIQSTVKEYADSSARAIEAGFDGVELHGANGYLIEQFLNPKSNVRKDAYGQNRRKFAVEVASAVVSKIGKDKVGYRISPYSPTGDLDFNFDGVDEFYTTLAKELSDVGLLYLHQCDHSSMGAPPVPLSLKESIRKNFTSGFIILTGGYDAKKAEEDINKGISDLVGFGRPFLANPDFVDKAKTGQELKAPDFSTFYTPGPKGYTDYV